MELYSGITRSLIEDCKQDRIALKLQDAFRRHFRFGPSPAEVGSWRNSLNAFCEIVQSASLLNHGVVLEYQLPLTSKRLDCVLTDRNALHCDNAVIVELKQWDHCRDRSGTNEITTWVGGTLRDVLHPSAQVGQYKMYLEDSHTAFHGENAIDLHACSYLHNYTFNASDVIFSPKFSSLLLRGHAKAANEGHLKTGQRE